MKKIKLVDRHGESIYKGVYDLDPSFWSDSIGTLGGLTKQVDKQPYSNHVWVYGCIQAISDPVSNLVHELYDTKNPDKTIESHDILSILSKPNPFMDEVTLWEATIAYLMLPTTRTKGGQCFWIGESGKKNQFTNWAKGEMPYEIYVFSDETIIADTDPLTGWIKGWKFIVAGKQIAYFTHEQVLRFYFYNPYSASQGLSPYSAVQSYVLQDSAADIYNTNMFNNNGRVAGYLQSETTDITEEQAKMIIEKWNQLYKGSGNAEKIALLPFGFKYEQFMKSYQDVQFKEQKVMNKEAVLAAYRVPESELSIYKTGMNKATSTQADKNFWQKRLLSLDKRIWRVINEGWIKNVAPKTLKGYSNLSTVEALQDDLNLKADSAFKYFQMNVPASEALRAVDAPIEWNKYKWLDRSFINSSLADAETMIGREPQAGFNPAMGASYNKSNSEKVIVKQKDMSIVDAILWNDYVEKVMESTERNFKKDFSERFLIKLRNEMLDKVDIWAKSNKAMDIFSIVTKDNLSNINQFVTNYGYFLKTDFEKSYNDYIEGGSSDNPSVFVSTGCLIIRANKELNSVSANNFLFDMQDANDDLVKIYKPFVKEQRQKQKQKLKEELKTPINWNVTIEEVDKFMKKRVKYLKEINSTTFRVAGNKIGSAIETALEEKQTVLEMAESIKDAIKSTIDIRQGHARTIARTEMGSIAQDARWQVFQEIDVTKHKWITAMDEKVRTSHIKLNGMVENIGDEFNDSGLRYPLDPQGDPEEVINCFLGDALIESPNGINKVFRNWYHGDIVTINFSDKTKLSGTVNHPILTVNGWIPLCEINKGDQVLKCQNSKGMTFGNSQMKTMIPTFTEIYNTFNNTIKSMRKPLRNVNFHGDIPASDVDIINVNSFLSDEINSFNFQEITNLVLAEPNFGKRLLFLECLLNFRRDEKFLRFISDSFVSVGSESDSLNGIASSHSAKHGVASISDNNPMFSEPESNYVAGNIKPFRQSFFRHPTNIFGNDSRVIQAVSVISTHKETSVEKEVYNLESPSSIYICNNVIVHNCRCITIPIEEE